MLLACDLQITFNEVDNIITVLYYCTQLLMIIINKNIIIVTQPMIKLYSE